MTGSVPRASSSAAIPAYALAASIIAAAGHAATTDVEGELEQIAVTENERFGGCMALLATSLADAGLACSGNWVSFDCAGQGADADRVHNALADALAHGKSVRLRVTDEHKDDGYCQATRLILQDGPFVDIDSDGDGVVDLEDDVPLDFFETRDWDDDGIGDLADRDDDNDGVPDTVDALPNDPDEWQDSDGDGLGDNADTDDDNDGLADVEDLFPLGNISFRLRQGSDRPRGIARSDSRMYILDGRDSRVYAYTLAGTRDPASDFDLEPHHREPLDVEYAAGHLYVVYERTTSVHAYRPSGERALQQEFDLHAGHRWPLALDYYQGHFRVLQWEGAGRKIYAYTLEGDHAAAHDFNVDTAIGMAAAFMRRGDALYLLDGGAGRAYAHGLGGDRDRAADFGIAHGYPTGGTYAARRFYVTYLNKGDHVPSFSDGGIRTPHHDFDPSPGTNDSPGGLAYRNGMFYVGDAVEGKVFVYSTTGDHLANRDFALEGGTTGWMVNVDGTILVTAGSGKILAYNEQGGRMRDGDLRTGMGQGPSGLAYALGRLYVGHRSTKQVSAFTLLGRRERRFDFHARAGTDGPRGITFGLGRFYVGDWQREDHLYAYGPAGQNAPSLDIALDGPFHSREGRGGPAGITFADGAVYVIEGRADRIVAYPAP